MNSDRQDGVKATQQAVCSEIKGCCRGLRLNLSPGVPDARLIRCGYGQANDYCLREPRRHVAAYAVIYQSRRNGVSTWVCERIILNEVLFLLLYKIKVMNQDNNKEMFPIVDEEGNIIGAATRGECHNGSKLLHPVVHLHVFNSRGELYLQKRPEWKDIQPGKWDTAVGGHVDLGESVEHALRREVREELGITDFTPQQVTRYVFESARERELVFAYKTVYDGPVTPSDELDGGRFWPVEEIRDNLGKGIFTPNFEGEVEKVL